jgi:hypothetical protein
MSRASAKTRMRVAWSRIISSIIDRSPPAENASPSPRMSTTRTASSAPASRHTSASSRCPVRSTAFSLPGSLMTIRNTPSAGQSIFSFS